MRGLLTAFVASAFFVTACNNSPEILVPAETSASTTSTNGLTTSTRPVNSSTRPPDSSIGSTSATNDGDTDQGDDPDSGDTTTTTAGAGGRTTENVTGPTSKATTSTTSTTAPSTDGFDGAYTVEIVEEHPHDVTAYTQGLEWYDGQLLESTGRASNGRSGPALRRWVDIETGLALIEQPLFGGLFGEGITMVNDQVFQITWKDGLLIVSDAEELLEQRVVSYTGVGWGLCFNGTELVMTDGSATLTFRDPATFEVVRSVEITAEGIPIEGVNELECVGSQVLGNVYGSDRLLAIDQATGAVTAAIDATALRPAGLAKSDLDTVMNGIALNPTTGHYFLTGKLWPVVYEVRFVRS